MSDYFFKNADADEIIFVHEGSGTLHTMYGQLRFEYGDYLVVPRGTVYQIHFDTPDNRLFIVESAGPVRTPRRYRNEFGHRLGRLSIPLRFLYPQLRAHNRAHSSTASYPSDF
jgi:homogentisate 1,2-dioxygenase